MRVGSLVYATEQGLGYLARDFHRHGVVTDVIVIHHGSRPNLHQEWYPGAGTVASLWTRQSQDRIKEFCRAQDAMLFFETPFVWDLIPFCREHKVRTFLMPMYECTADPLPAVPDAFLCPSLLDFDYYSDSARGPAFLPHGSNRRPATCYWTPVPVDTAEFPWRGRGVAERFIHNAGHGGLKGRNGTAELMEAIPHVKSPAEIVIRMQTGSAGGRVPDVTPGGGPIRYAFGTVPRDRLYADGDVFVFPEKFNGLSLPIQEAFASGMCVMATHRHPNTAYLPLQPLIPIAGTRRNRVAARCAEFDEAVIDPRQLAAHIDEWYGREIDGYSAAGRAWAAAHSWEVLRPKYLEALES